MSALLLLLIEVTWGHVIFPVLNTAGLQEEKSSGAKDELHFQCVWICATTMLLAFDRYHSKAYMNSN